VASVAWPKMMDSNCCPARAVVPQGHYPKFCVSVYPDFVFLIPLSR